jgi:hypothetical protein
MKVLLVGNGNHQFITNYALWLNKQGKNKYIIDILSFLPVIKVNKKYYNEIFNIKLFLITNLIYKIKGIRRYFRFFQYKKVLKTLGNYDIIHFHFINIDSYFLVDRFKQYTKSRIILSIWGSDMYRIRSNNEYGFKNACKKADSITFTNQQSLKYFKLKYNWQKKNLKLCRFGLAPLEYLNVLKITREKCKELLNWNPDKLALTIGYNLAIAQQHLEILNLLDNKTIKILKDKIQLVLPMTYGGTTKYKNELLTKLNQLPYDFIIYDSFLKDEKVALIRKASDIMIQLQKTDQFSGSMQEHLFARNVVITGSWLPYETMKEHGAHFIEIDKIEDLVKVLQEVIINFKKHEKSTVNNPKAILGLCSWEKNIKIWAELYN